MITLDTPFVGVYSGNEDHLITQFSKHKTHRGKKTDLERAKRLAPLYIKYGQLFNLRADFAWPQMEHETGFLTFLGDVKPHQNNFAGIGATGGVPGNSFSTEELGVIAHYSHLAWYFYREHINEYCSNKYDPRHFIIDRKIHPKYTGDVTLGHLAGSWAVPGTTYAQSIFKLAQEIENVSIEKEKSSEKFDIIVQMGHVGRTSGATGTAGEQEFVKSIGEKLHNMLINKGINSRLMGADNWLKPEPNKSIIFFSLHCDGSTNKNARGFSCGFKPGTDQRFKEKMAIKYKELTGFARRPDNYTESMRLYYAWRDYSNRPTHVVSDFYLLLEHGFLTNVQERNWLLSHKDKIVNNHYSVIVDFLKEVK